MDWNPHITEKSHISMEEIAIIVDKIKNAAFYYGLSDKIKNALTFLKSTDFESMAAGKYAIDSDNVYAIVQGYDTKPFDELIWESHKKYIDIHYLVTGSELMGYANVNSLKVIKEYDADNDFISLSGNGNFVCCEAGTFVILGREDAHMPGVSSDYQQRVKKVVIKVSI